MPDHTESIRSTYDRIATRYEHNQLERDAHLKSSFPALERSFLERVARGGRIADLGCGPGFDAGRFASQGFETIGLDLSIGMLSTATDRLAGQVVQGDLRALPMAQGVLDAVWSAACLLHVPERHTVQVLGEFRRVLRRSGTLALVTALGESARLEAVPYAPGEQRWFVYRDRARL